MNSSKVLIIAFLLFVGYLKVSTAQATKYVNRLEPDCVTFDFHDSGSIRYFNHCGVTIHMMTIWENPKARHGGAAFDIQDGKWQGGGTTEELYYKYGGAARHVCPAGSVAVNQEGKPVYRDPVTDYKCLKK